MLVAWCALLALGTKALGQTAEPAKLPVDFRTRVEPILQAHCVSCHGPSEAKGGLRLDRRAYAARGGDSGKSLLKMPLDENELIRRVSAADRNIIMPPEGPKLSQVQIATLEAWIAEGAPWPTSTSDAPQSIHADKDKGFWKTFDAFVPFFEHHLRLPLAIVLPFLILYWIAVRTRRRQKATTNEAPSSLSRTIAHFGPSHLWIVVLLMTLLTTTTYLAELHERLATQEKRLKQRRLATSPTAEDVVGDEGKPIRPHHPKRLGGTYYRGNDERNEKLFNNGFYRTATFHLSLLDQDKRKLGLGDRIEPGQRLFVRVEIERSPFATPALFSKEVMEQAYLTDLPEGTEIADATIAPVPFRTAVEGERWLADYPIDLPASGDADPLKGLIHVYKGNADTQISGTHHYGVEYELVVTQGKLDAASELWMGPTYVTGNVMIPVPGKMSIEEWFDWRPLPEIPHEQTKDPKLLGVPEHLGADYDPSAQEKSPPE
ncbi:c-type cytochrome domain-containing protein [Kolteria novifilia]|uniref:c-type cytochrome domain-containing protein n=1 Tax=Kolteria novifilia TaxID=2527975 RepID=UPI003AF3F269